MRTQQKKSEFELNTQTQISLKLSYFSEFRDSFLVSYVTHLYEYQSETIQNKIRDDFL